MSMSCFTRPGTRSIQHQPAKTALISPVAMQRMGYNFKLIPKTDEVRIGEIQEIESIA
jgi:hypothetical protein